ncbi:MAG: bifunctional phosphopantothenoylcysteine decarboxylase/phosphopantothenate--cysteine ligase CoaBC [Alphaproteobacteria bacterium]|nr:bifunctional phosphopantothenoylcysteine decarboxylase/phosphopantothenate--cysteine ligase CoaBC [Rhodospirillales bacterium]MCW9044773.1 bifunctional phosphopantothenoylcysteine decarboxylase/phosphopantothenate--cysteine ligase CoaBC [Alphaproteobacteria bacterium]
MLAGKRILLIITGGIAAYKSLELIRALKKRDASVRCILTKGGEQFVTPMSVAALTGEKVFQNVFSLTDESEMGHIELSRSADLVVVAPATANILAQMANGFASDLATTCLLATDKPVMVAPAMNVRMWEHLATQANVATLKSRGVSMVGPTEGAMACNEFGMGRLAEPTDILAAIENHFGNETPLAGKKIIVTSGPTHEPIDPVRYIANHSSGKQGHAIASALARLGAETILVSGPTNLPDPAGVEMRKITTAVEMLQACETSLPADGVICAAAVADWRVENQAGQKLKKEGSEDTLALSMVQNPDVLATISQMSVGRPSLVVGFAAETEKVIEHAVAKRQRKGCDWIVANDVSPETGTFGGDSNLVHMIDGDGTETWPRMSKDEVANKLSLQIAQFLGGKE